MCRVAEQYNEEMGYEMDAFNLKGERDLGHFEASGNFVWKKDPNVVTDPWLAEMDADTTDDKAMAARREAHAKRLAAEEAASGGGGILSMAALPRSRDELLTLIVSHLQPRESVPAALRRLKAAAAAEAAAAAAATATAGASTDGAPTAPVSAAVPAAGPGKLSWRQQKAAREAARAAKGPTAPPVSADGEGAAGAGDGKPPAGVSSAAAAAAAAVAVTPSGQAFNALTEAADELMGIGLSAVYEDMKELLQRRIGRPNMD